MLNIADQNNISISPLSRILSQKDSCSHSNIDTTNVKIKPEKSIQTVISLFDKILECKPLLRYTIANSTSHIIAAISQDQRLYEKLSLPINNTHNIDRIRTIPLEIFTFSHKKIIENKAIVGKSTTNDTFAKFVCKIA